VRLYWHGGKSVKDERPTPPTSLLGGGGLAGVCGIGGLRIEFVRFCVFSAGLWRNRFHNNESTKIIASEANRVRPPLSPQSGNSEWTKAHPYGRASVLPSKSYGNTCDGRLSPCSVAARAVAQPDLLLGFCLERQTIGLLPFISFQSLATSTRDFPGAFGSGG